MQRDAILLSVFFSFFRHLIFCTISDRQAIRLIITHALRIVIRSFIIFVAKYKIISTNTYMLQIRRTRIEEVDKLMDIFEQSRRIMRESGNLKQWTGGYPTRKIVEKDVKDENSYVCVDEAGKVIGTFAFIYGEDPTYIRIYEGRWLDNERPYATIHRLASTKDSHGVAAACLDWCARQISNLRADTHRDNHILQHILLKHGFTYCGIIYLQNGDERLAYQKIILP